MEKPQGKNANHLGSKGQVDDLDLSKAKMSKNIDVATKLLD